MDVAAKAKPSDSLPRCPFCHDDVREDPRACPACAAVHHAECSKNGCASCSSPFVRNVNPRWLRVCDRISLVFLVVAMVIATGWVVGGVVTLQGAHAHASAPPPFWVDVAKEPRWAEDLERADIHNGRLYIICAALSLACGLLSFLPARIARAIIALVRWIAQA